MEDWAPLRWIVLGCALLVAPFMPRGTAGPTGNSRPTASRRAAWSAGRHGAAGAARTTTHVEYRFRDDAGRLHYATQRGLGYPLYRSLRIGQPITVTYSRSNPDASAVYLNVLWEQVATQSLISLLIGLCAAAGTWWWTYARRKTREYDAGLEPPPADASSGLAAH